MRIALVNAHEIGRESLMRRCNLKGLLRSMHLHVSWIAILAINIINAGSWDSSVGKVKNENYHLEVSSLNLLRYALMHFRE